MQMSEIPQEKLSILMDSIERFLKYTGLVHLSNFSFVTQDVMTLLIKAYVKQVDSPFMLWNNPSIVINNGTAWETQEQVSIFRGEEFSTNLTPKIK